jgi:hypothetical protein
MLTRRKMLQGMGAASTLGLTGCGKISSRLNLVFHGLMIHQVRYTSDDKPKASEIWIHMPKCAEHVYCLTRPGKTKPNDRIALDDSADRQNDYRLTGVKGAGDFTLPDPSCHGVITPPPTTASGPGNVDATCRAVRLRLPLPQEIISLRPSRRQTSGANQIFSGDGAKYHKLDQLKQFPLVYVFRYHDAVDAKIVKVNDDAAVKWSASGGQIEGLNVHAEIPGCATKGNHFKCLTDVISCKPDYLYVTNNDDTKADALDNGTGDLFGIWDSDFYGLPDGHVCIMISDPGSCGQLWVDGGGGD